MTEEWRPIPGFPHYEVSNFGRVVSHYGQRPRELRGHMERRGHMKLRLRTPSGTKANLYIHAAVAEAFIGPRPEGMAIRHLNGNSQDNRLSNLAYGTTAENNWDMVRHGTHLNVQKSSCPQSHPYDEHAYQRNGRRHCRPCRAESTRKWRERRQSTPTKETQP